MNNRTTFQQLALLVSDRLNRQPQEIELELKALFEKVSAELISDGRSELPEIGSFSVVKGTVVFDPTPEMKCGVNSPFEMFEATRLNDEVTEEMLEQVVRENVPETDDLVKNQEIITIPSAEISVEQISAEIAIEPEILPDVHDTVGHEETSEKTGFSNTVTSDESITNVKSFSDIETIIPNDNEQEDTVAATVNENTENREIATETNLIPENEIPAESSISEISSSSYSSDYEENDDDEGLSPWLMFWIGTVIGIAIGASACFFYIS